MPVHPPRALSENELKQHLFYGAVSFFYQNFSRNLLIFIDIFVKMKV
ncbi:hypothetical protein B4119_2325 [Parageobacillus caldoxylosilyticus]|uniref:Uncharacterized protein n=1 Tax=Saccharococcus caldoxylosilyticus TaxID=81408 RepID=A0A150LWA5_9BACL|nr:hypothetical protein B4119_2325 [Parageobacillus caldoxylosilyticus]